ncbi:MAG TPA: DUF1800 domain-containing protein [bacterium]|nr:DUF1800 domain-containing protein [bacterium]
MAEALLRKYRPTASNPWDYAKAAHLLSRAGFGGRPEEIERLVGLGSEGAVEELLNYDRVAETLPSLDFTEVRQALEDAFRARQARADEPTLRALQNKINRLYREKFQETREWWMTQLVQTGRPLQEKMVLFWHGLLVSGFPETRNPEFLYGQNQLFRRMALGNFKELILAISRDPAMLDYLDNNSNRKGRPNENYARELLELFTMGIGNYTETDIKEAARAFTGWTHRFGEFTFVRAQHDEGMKTFLGKTGNFDGTDIINIIFEHPATARWLPRKLFEYFAYLRPEDALIEDLGNTFRRVTFEVKPVVQAILQSEAFYSPAAMRTQVKSPVQLVVGTARALAAPASMVRGLVLAADQMGMVLLYPPNVGGWPKGEGWITTSTVLDRYNFGSLMTSARMPGVPNRFLQSIGTFPVTSLVPASAQTAGAIVDSLVRRLLPGVTLEQKRVFALWRAVGASRAAEPVQPSPERVRSAVRLIMSIPEFQLT